jgi:hypothetical protein
MARRSSPFAPRRHALARVPRVVWYGVLALAAAAVASQIAAKERELRQGRIADAEAWDIQGPPCPAITRDQFLVRGQRGPHGFTYEDVTFMRRFGHVTCAPIYEDGGRGRRFHPACQFTSPGDLMIRMRAGDWYFHVGPGRPATVFTSAKGVRCVLASKYTVANFNSAPG